MRSDVIAITSVVSQIAAEMHLAQDDKLTTDPRRPEPISWPRRNIEARAWFTDVRRFLRLISADKMGEVFGTEYCPHFSHF